LIYSLSPASNPLSLSLSKAARKANPAR